MIKGENNIGVRNTALDIIYKLVHREHSMVITCAGPYCELTHIGTDIDVTYVKQTHTYRDLVTDIQTNHHTLI